MALDNTDIESQIWYVGISECVKWEFEIVGDIKVAEEKFQGTVQFVFSFEVDTLFRCDNF